MVVRKEDVVSADNQALAELIEEIEKCTDEELRHTGSSTIRLENVARRFQDVVADTLVQTYRAAGWKAKAESGSGGRNDSYYFVKIQ